MTWNSTPLWATCFWLHFRGGNTYFAEILDRLPVDDQWFALLRVRPKRHESLLPTLQSSASPSPLDKPHPELTLYSVPLGVFSCCLPLEHPRDDFFDQMSVVLLSWEFNGYEPDLDPPSGNTSAHADALVAAWDRLTAVDKPGGRIVCENCEREYQSRCGLCQRQTCPDRTAWEGTTGKLCGACYAALWVRDFSETGICRGANRTRQLTLFTCTQERPWNPDLAFVHDTVHPDAVLQEHTVVYDDWYEYYRCPHCRVLFYERVTK